MSTHKQDERVFVHTVDARDTIISVNDDWLRFAEENRAPHLTRAAVLGRPLWEFIEDQHTRHLYGLVLARVRSAGTGVGFPFRCDSPEVRRFMRMELVPDESGVVEFRCTLLREEAREERIKLLEAGTEQGAEQLLRACSWCRRIDVEGAWVEAEEAVKRLDLMAQVPTPSMTHTICNDCYAMMKNRIEPEDLPPP
ncbi:MAG TPA: hypothetical protein VNX25_10575, partial [Verrucomicrobiae bacterium]|nr:hypothetical protein [Verrucomicrobiae bacterium]